MKYCKDAWKLLGKKIVCGRDCPMVKNCPRSIMEDATDEGINRAIEAMIRSYLNGKQTQDNSELLEGK